MKLENTLTIFCISLLGFLLLLVNFYTVKYNEDITGQIVLSDFALFGAAASGDKNACNAIASTYAGNLDVLPKSVLDACRFPKTPSFSTQVDNLNLEQLDTNLKNVDNSIAQLDLLGSAMSNSIPSLKEEKTTLEGEFISLKTEIPKLATTISEFDTKLRKVNSDLSKAKSKPCKIFQTSCKTLKNQEVSKFKSEADLLNKDKSSAVRNSKGKTVLLNNKRAKLSDLSSQIQLAEQVKANIGNKKNELNKLKNDITNKISELEKEILDETIRVEDEDDISNAEVSKTSKVCHCTLREITEVECKKKGIPIQTGPETITPWEEGVASGGTWKVYLDRGFGMSATKCTRDLIYPDGACNSDADCIEGCAFKMQDQGSTARLDCLDTVERICAKRGGTTNKLYWPVRKEGICLDVVSAP